MSHGNKVQPIRVKIICIAAIRVTCMKDLVSVVKLLVKAFFFCSLFPYPPPPAQTLAPTRAYVKRMKDNEMRHVIHGTRISSGQCPRRDITVRYGLQGHTGYTPEERHISVNKHRSGEETQRGGYMSSYLTQT
jgi:hypothetical protein